MVLDLWLNHSEMAPESGLVVLRADVVELHDGVVGVGEAPHRLRLVDGLAAVRIHRVDLQLTFVIN